MYIIRFDFCKEGGLAAVSKTAGWERCTDQKRYVLLYLICIFYCTAFFLNGIFTCISLVGWSWHCVFINFSLRLEFNKAHGNSSGQLNNFYNHFLLMHFCEFYILPIFLFPLSALCLLIISSTGVLHFQCIFLIRCKFSSSLSTLITNICDLVGLCGRVRQCL